GGAEQRRPQGDALRVVPGAGSDDAPGTLLGGQLRNSVVGSPDLEGTGALEVLALEQSGPSSHSRQDPGRPHRCPQAHLLEALACRPDFVASHELTCRAPAG